MLVSYRSHTRSAFYIVIFYFSIISIKTHDVNVKNVFYATVLYFMTQVLQFLFVLVTLLLSILKITQYSYTQKLDMIQLNAGKYN